MKKIIIGLFLGLFVAVVIFIAYRCNQLYKDYNKPLTAEQLAKNAYFQQHEKRVGTSFSVDSMVYTIFDFNYFFKENKTVLIVDMRLENKTKGSKVFIDSCFAVKDETQQVFYPDRTPFTVFEGGVQNLKIIYTLPKRQASYVLYELNINSKMDSTQNALLVFRKSYRAGG